MGKYSHTAWRRTTELLTRRLVGIISVLAILVTAVPVYAQSDEDAQVSVQDQLERSTQSDIPETAIVLGLRETHFEIVMPKDPILAGILSAGFPGMGQIYTGNWTRGLAFMGGVAASLISVGLAGDELQLTAEDYDAVARGGDGNNIVTFDEYQAWEDNPNGDFADLSTPRQAIIIGGLGAALGLYVWSTVDAYVQANNHNRRLYSKLTGMQVSVGVTPDGRTQARFSLPL
jgi:hypothetical protein